MNPLFPRIGIVGVGLIGGSIGLRSRKMFKNTKVLGVGRSVDRLRMALDAGAIDELSTSLEALRDCDLVILATPIEHILTTLDSISGCLKTGSLVTDVGSTKRTICDTAWRKLPDAVEFIGGHPIAGREVAGVENCLYGLFEGAPYILCPHPDRLSGNLGKLREFVDSLGACDCVMTPAEHDQALAWLSHLPQVLSTALACEMEDLRTELSGSGLRGMLRLASSPYSVWQGIFETNRDNIDLALDRFIRRLEDARLRMRSGELAPEFERAARVRNSLSPAQAQNELHSIPQSDDQNQ